MIFSASIGPLKSIVAVMRKFISFHQNDGTVQLRSFQSLAQIGYATQGNYFLRLTSITHIRISRDRLVSKKRIAMSASTQKTEGESNPVVP